LEQEKKSSYKRIDLITNNYSKKNTLESYTHILLRSFTPTYPLRLGILYPNPKELKFISVI